MPALHLLMMPFPCRVVVVAAGGVAASNFLNFERSSPPAPLQTAYGIYARVEGYEKWCDPNSMNFQDFRMTYSGTGSKGPIFDVRNDTPSFLYAMPLADGSILLEETCLGSHTPITFQQHKTRLERRLAAMEVKVRILLYGFEGRKRLEGSSTEHSTVTSNPQ